VKADSEKPAEEPGTEPGSVEQEARTCPVCGTKFFATADNGFCPVCILRGATGGNLQRPANRVQFLGRQTALARETESGSQARRFEHYEVMLDGNGKPIELGRGAMGVTYKALDVDLRCPVTLKVISERYLDEESARLRFCARRVRRPACTTRTLPRFSTWAGPAGIISTRWSTSLAESVPPSDPTCSLPSRNAAGCVSETV
jgi:hypothetical protein